MADLANIRAGIAAAIKEAIPDVQCTGYLLENPFPPAFEVEIGSDGITYDEAMSRGLDEVYFTIRGFAASGTDAAAQKRLDGFLNSTGGVSVKAALEEDRTLGGTVSDAHVTKVNQVRSFTPVASPGSSFYGAEWTLRTLVAGD